MPGSTRGRWVESLPVEDQVALCHLIGYGQYLDKQLTEQLAKQHREQHPLTSEEELQAAVDEALPALLERERPAFLDRELRALATRPRRLGRHQASRLNTLPSTPKAALDRLSEAAWFDFVEDQYDHLLELPNRCSLSRLSYSEQGEWFDFLWDRLPGKLGQFDGTSSQGSAGPKARDVGQGSQVRTPLRSWLFTVVMRLYISWGRRQGRRPLPVGWLDELPGKIHEGPDTPLASAEALRRVIKAARNLTPDRRLAVFLPELSDALEEADLAYLAQKRAAAGLAETMDDLVATLADLAARKDDQALADYLYQRGTPQARKNRLHSARRHAREALREALEG